MHLARQRPLRETGHPATNIISIPCLPTESSSLYSHKYAYLDDIALEPGVSQSRSFKKRCKSKKRLIHQQHPPSIKGIDLKDSSGQLLGTVMQIDNCLSPPLSKNTSNPWTGQPLHKIVFTQNTTADTDLLVRSTCKTEFTRLGYFFGQDTSASLLLSQHTTTAESALLRTINYVQHLYVNFVNKQMEQIIGQKGKPENLKHACFMLHLS